MVDTRKLFRFGYGALKKGEFVYRLGCVSSVTVTETGGQTI